MKNLLLLSVIALLLAACNNNPEKIFKGELIIVNNPSTDKLTGKKINLDGLYAGALSVRDSIISFAYHNYGNYHVANFNVNTGRHIGNFFKKGQGPGEFIDFYRLHPGANYDFWIDEFNKRHYVLVDMSTGEEKKRINLSTFKKKGFSPFIQAFILDDSLLIAVNQPEIKNLDYDMMVPKYSIINYLSKEEIAGYELYDENLYNKLRAPGMENEHLIGTSHIKPDKSKVAGVMNYLYQLNILDLKTGELKGYRLAGTPGFEFVSTLLSPETVYSYGWANEDEKFIYIMLSNTHSPEVKPVFHVFDWDGNFVRILEPDQKGTDFALDNVQKKLYTKDDEENVWVYDVSYLYK